MTQFGLSLRAQKLLRRYLLFLYRDGYYDMQIAGRPYILDSKDGIDILLEAIRVSSRMSRFYKIREARRELKKFETEELRMCRLRQQRLQHAA